MMVVVALKHSMWRTWRGTSRAAFGAFMDGALVLAAFAISLTYLIEIDSVCLIDTVTGNVPVSWPKPKGRGGVCRNHGIAHP